MNKLIRYGGVGFMSMTINYFLFTAGIAVGLHYLVSATICSFVTVTFSYFMNRNFTFTAKGNASVREFASFLTVFLIQYALAMGGYAVLIGYLRIGPSVAFVLNNIIVTAVAFTLLRRFTFGDARTR